MVYALEYFLIENPAATDFAIDAFRKAASMLPQSIDHRYGQGPAGPKISCNGFSSSLQASSRLEKENLVQAVMIPTVTMAMRLTALTFALRYQKWLTPVLQCSTSLIIGTNSTLMSSSCWRCWDGAMRITRRG